MSAEMALREVNGTGTLQRHHTEQLLLPSVTVEKMLERRNAIRAIIEQVFIEDIHYGKIPGTGDKAKSALLKAGAEELCVLFNLTARFEFVEKVEDWTGEDHGGEGFLGYTVRCSLYRGDTLLGDNIGSTNSWEKKHRYRYMVPKCPTCGVEAVKIKKNGEAWCNRATGGCGAGFSKEEADKFPQGTEANKDFAEVQNTLIKMSCKRALVATTLVVTGCSAYFTQDTEDWDNDNQTNHDAGGNHSNGAANKSTQRTTYNGQGEPPKPNGNGATKAKLPKRDAWFALVKDLNLALTPDQEYALFNECLSVSMGKPMSIMRGAYDATAGGVSEALYEKATIELRNNGVPPPQNEPSSSSHSTEDPSAQAAPHLAATTVSNVPNDDIDPFADE